VIPCLFITSPNPHGPNKLSSSQSQSRIRTAPLTISILNGEFNILSLRYSVAASGPCKQEPIIMHGQSNVVDIGASGERSIVKGRRVERQAEIRLWNSGFEIAEP
jgi:hypothetical protein